MARRNDPDCWRDLDRLTRMLLPAALAEKRMINRLAGKPCEVCGEIQTVERHYCKPGSYGPDDIPF